MERRNFLLGKGERLTESIIVKRGGGLKEAPYTFEETRERLATMLSQTVSEVDKLPSVACPRDEAVISLTLHPEYIAKSYFPRKLLDEVGVRVVGSRPTKVTPKKFSHDRKLCESVTTELFARGKRSAIRGWRDSLSSWTDFNQYAKELVQIEIISVSGPRNKIKGALPDTGILQMEAVFHVGEEIEQILVLEDFKNFLEESKVPTQLGRCFFAKGLCFLELETLVDRTEEIATFSNLRCLRQMPGLRVLNPTTCSSEFQVSVPHFPNDPPVSKDVRVAVFDGGIPENHPITNWVTPHEFPNMEPATSKFESHGVAVTSALLFGHIEPDLPIKRPYSFIDHYRVLDKFSDQNPFELYEVLERIDSVLSNKEYDFVNLSIGPKLPIEDDEIHAWTAVLDDRFASSSTLAAIAVGNNGESDSKLGIDRIQVPSDCINALAVGACDTPDDNWHRASYSSVGPGRSPGLVKPDVVDFGGSMERPFIVCSADMEPKLKKTSGTSFATPSVVRMASGVRAHFGPNLNHLAIRALLIHTVEVNECDHKQVGWGRVARDLNDIVLCDDEMVRVVYQGEISPAKYVRAMIPVPDGKISGLVLIEATICYKSQTDPHHPSNYTQAGLEITFRPHDKNFKNSKQMHANSKPFFGSSMLGATEVGLRRDSWKWENCFRSSKRMQGQSLQNPCFDIHYNSRLEGQNYAPNQNLPYALVVTVRAKSMADFYDQIVRKYTAILEPLRPMVEVPIQI